MIIMQINDFGCSYVSIWPTIIWNYLHVAKFWDQYQNHFRYVPTVFDNHNSPMVFDGLQINLELWDTAGQEGYKEIRPLAYTNVRDF